MEGLIHLATLQCRETTTNIKKFNSELGARVLGLNVGNLPSLSISVHPAHFDSMGHDHEYVALNLCSSSNRCYPCCVLLLDRVSEMGVSYNKNILIG